MSRDTLRVSALTPSYDVNSMTRDRARGRTRGLPRDFPSLTTASHLSSIALRDGGSEAALQVATPICVNQQLARHSLARRLVHLRFLCLTFAALHPCVRFSVLPD
jgi:hypothetical protein